jgi:serine/threonine-protein kinase
MGTAVRNHVAQLAGGGETVKKLVLMPVLALLVVACGPTPTPHVVRETVEVTRELEVTRLVQRSVDVIDYRTVVVDKPIPIVIPSTPYPTHTPYPTPIAGWNRYQVGGIELWLPGSYEGGDPNEDIDWIVERLSALGPEFEYAAELIRQNPSMLVLWAFDTEVGESGFLTNALVSVETFPSAVSLGTLVEMVGKQLPTGWTVVEQGIVNVGDRRAGRLVHEAQILGQRTRQLVYLFRSGSRLYSLYYSTGADEYADRLPEFERSARTFRVVP